MQDFEQQIRGCFSEDPIVSMLLVHLDFLLVPLNEVACRDDLSGSIVLWFILNKLFQLSLSIPSPTQVSDFPAHKDGGKFYLFPLTRGLVPLMTEVPKSLMREKRVVEGVGL